MFLTKFISIKTNYLCFFVISLIFRLHKYGQDNQKWKYHAYQEKKIKKEKNFYKDFECFDQGQNLEEAGVEVAVEVAAEAEAEGK